MAENWSLILAEYPRLMFNDDLPLIVLSFLERDGLTSEDELIEKIGQDPSTIKKILVDLKMNQCLEYGRHHIRLTIKGKFLNDRFQLQDPILDDVLDTLHVTGDIRDSYKILLQNYRNDSYRLYLNSLGSIRVWKQLCEPIQEGKQKQDVSIGMMTIVLRDLRNWLQNNQLVTEISREIDPSLRAILTKQVLLEAKIDKGMIHRGNSKLDKCLLMLDGLDELESIKLGSKTLHSPRKKTEYLFLWFHNFQANSEPDTWYDNLYGSIKKIIPNPQKGPNKYKTELIQILSGSTDPFPEFYTRPAKFKLNWSVSDNTPRSVDNLLELILISPTIDDLSSATGYNKFELQNILKMISAKCENLIGSQPGGKTTK